MNPEAAIIGGILLSQGQALDELTLSPDEFNDPKLGKVFTAMREMRQKHEPIDPITVGAKLPEVTESLWNWQSEVPTAENIGFYASMVRDNAIRRRLGYTAQRLIRESDKEDLDALIDTARR